MSKCKLEQKTRIDGGKRYELNVFLLIASPEN